MSGVKAIRRAFLTYFEQNGHMILPSSPLVPHGDPTLLFTNAGMVQFKNIFTGVEAAHTPRVATAQKILRAGGKHNDLDNVGYTARHHTFFEMLGNFSFGDYFKERAIELAWNLITKEFDIPPARLWVTVYAEDREARDLWRRIAGLPEERIVSIATEDNFWSMGDVGPCGPCSEIFYDHGPDLPGAPPGSPEGEGDRFVEIWNLVFMQFDQRSKEERVSLPKPSIDTGMGLERIAAVLQGVHSNYDIDLFQGLIAAIETVTGVSMPRSEGVGAAGNLQLGASHRVVADHLRAMGFLIADGVLPAREGRGYVLRRIMRRAMRHLRLLGVEEPILYRLVPALCSEMGEAYPELLRAETLIVETLRLEEELFGRTLHRGLALLDTELASLTSGQVLKGETAFKLYDTYGFPLDLTQDIARGQGIGVDSAGFEAALEAQKEEARRSWKGSGAAAPERIWFDIKEEFGPTGFLGHTQETAMACLQALVQEGKRTEELQAGAEGFAVFDETPFYAESGGQIGDTGWGSSPKRDLPHFEIKDVQKKADGVFVHRLWVKEGVLHVGQILSLQLDRDRRQALRLHHSATHLLHAALREVLGPHVTQKGSLVSPERLRFDFSHPKPMRPAELAAVEERVNYFILQNSPVLTSEMPVKEAMASGAMALFGEKYQDFVRVVTMGLQKEEKGRAGQEEEETTERPYSVELCGGTHVAHTGEIGLMVIVAESAVGSGVRRIEAMAGPAARAYFKEQEIALKAVADLLKVRSDAASPRVEALLAENKQLKQEISTLRQKLALGSGSKDSLQEGIEQIGPYRFFARIVQNVSPNEMKALADAGKKAVESGIVAILGKDANGKASLVVGVTADLTPHVNAVDLVRIGAAHLGGKGGGGRPDLAQAGGSNADTLPQAMKALRDAVAALAPQPSSSASL